MFQNHLSSISGVAIFPLISFVAFFLFFIAVAVYAWKQDKKEIERMSELPLTDKTIPQEHEVNR